MNAPVPTARRRRPHHLPLLRRRLRRARDAGRARRRRRSRRSRASGEFRPAVLQGLGARRDAGARRPAAASDDAAGDGTLARVDWDDGARPRRGRLHAHRRASTGPDAVAFYLSGQLLTEDYYVANKLMKGFIGSRQCRHQFAAVHGVVGRRPPARLRRRHRAGLLRGSRRGRPDRAGRLERRLVPSGPVPAHDRRTRARAARRSS